MDEGSSSDESEDDDAKVIINIENMFNSKIKLNRS